MTVLENNNNNNNNTLIKLDRRASLAHKKWRVLHAKGAYCAIVYGRVHNGVLSPNSLTVLLIFETAF